MTTLRKTTLQRPVRVLGAGLAALALASAATAPGASAASGDDVDVVNTETVQVYVRPDGSIESQRVYEQLTLTGSGSTEIANPIEEQGLRNLNGFGSPDVDGGVQSFEVDVDGVERLRSVSDYTGELPLDITVEYRLDGELVEPGDVVGADGELEVLYTARNITAQPQEVTFADGQGGTVTETVDVPIPMVGSLTTVAPPNFAEVSSQQANMAGDGKGGTKLSFTMTLFPPIGSDTAEFGYTATISDGVVPSSSVSALPVNPLESPSFKTAGDSYQGGSETGIELAEGATEIDANLLKLRDGAGSLLDGLIKLSDGADELTSGLAGEAAPGATKLAAGAGDLDEGLGKIDDGAGKLADGAGDLDEGLGKIDDGAGKLADGADRAEDGSGTLADGAGRLSDGLGDLDSGVGDLDVGAGQLAAGQKALVGGLKKLRAGVQDLPASVKAKLDKDPQYQAFLGALGRIAVGVGTRTDLPTAGTLLGGLNGVQYGLRWPVDILGPTDCATALTGGTPQKCGAMDGVQLVAQQLGQGAGDLDQLKPLFDTLNKTNGVADPTTGAMGAPCPGYPDYVPPAPSGPTTPCQVVATLYYSQFAPAGGQAKLNAASKALTTIYEGVDAGLLGPIVPGQPRLGALNQLRAGLSTGVNPLTCQAAPQNCGIREAGLFLQQYGTPALVTGITEGIRDELLTGVGQSTPGCNPEETLLCAATTLSKGGGKLTRGINKLVAGVVELNDGGALLANGAGDLTAGLGELSAGAGTLATGTGEASDGSRQLSDGAAKLADGTGTASEGSGKLADGAGDLADGLGDAADGSSRLADGLAKAEDGAPALVDGADRLSKEGMSKLIDAGEDTAQDYGKLYATIEAGAERADTERMAYGAPAGAQGMTAYTYELLGDDGESGRNTKRGLAALGLLGLGGGAFFLRRRLI